MHTNRFSKTIVAALVIAVALVTARMIPAGFTSVSFVESQEQTLRESQLGERYVEITRYIVEEDLASLSYLSRLNNCFDVPFSELANCRSASRPPTS